MNTKFFVIRGLTDCRERGVITLSGVLPEQPGESFSSLKEAVKVLEAMSDPRGFLIIEVISPQIEVKVTVKVDD
jgi:hypothetical protein